MSTRRGINWGIRIHSIHKWEVMFFLVCTSKRLWKRFEINVDVQKGALSFTINLINRLIVSSNSCFHPLLSYGNSPQWQPCAFWVYIVGSRCLQIKCAWSAHGLHWVLLSILWLSYYAFVYVCLMQALSYILWMKICSMTFSLESESGFHM